MSSTVKVIAIIPARYQSGRFPGKPLSVIDNKPMIQHVVERAKESKTLSMVVVATDDQRIADTVNNFGGEVVITGNNHISGTDRLAEAAEMLNIKNRDIVVNIQGDQPLFPPAVIKQVAEPLLQDENLPMSTLVYKITRPEEITDPNHVKTVFDCNNNALYFSRSTIPYIRADNNSNSYYPYYKHLGFYAYRKEFLSRFVKLKEGRWEKLEKLEQLRALENGFTIRVIETEHDSIEVDTPADAKRVEKLILQNKKTGE